MRVGGYLRAELSPGGYLWLPPIGLEAFVAAAWQSASAADVIRRYTYLPVMLMLCRIKLIMRWTCLLLRQLDIARHENTKANSRSLRLHISASVWIPDGRYNCIFKTTTVSHLCQYSVVSKYYIKSMFFGSEMQSWYVDIQYHILFARWAKIYIIRGTQSSFVSAWGIHCERKWNLLFSCIASTKR